MDSELSAVNTRLVEYNEPEDGPLCRLELKFAQEGAQGPLHAVVLLNESEAAEWVRNRVEQLKGPFTEVDMGGPCLQLEVQPQPQAEPQALAKGEQTAPAPPTSDYPLSSYTLCTDGSRLVVPLKDLKDAPLAVCGLIITGKQFLRHPLVGARMLPKNTPTPFVADQYGDSWNDNFFKEPRVVEDVPSTAFRAITSIMAVAKGLYPTDKRVAEKKYRKAFHYAHSYFPEELSPEDTAALTTLKANALLNAVMCELQLGEWHQAVKNASYVLDIVEISDVQRAKAHFRRGKAMLALGDEREAEADFRTSQALVADAATEALIAECQRRAKRNIWR